MYSFHQLMCTVALLYFASSLKICTVISGSDSPASGASSNTATSTYPAQGVALNVMAEVAHQAVFPLVDRPLPIRKRQRKPNRKTVQTEADSPSVTSPTNKRGRKPKAAGATHLLLCATLHWATACAQCPCDCNEPALVLCACMLLFCVCAY